MISNDLENKLTRDHAISLKSEQPLCHAFLCMGAVYPPMPIDEIHIEIATADRWKHRSSVWLSLDIVSKGLPEPRLTLMQFDETFFEMFVRHFVLASGGSVVYSIPTQTLMRVHAIEHITYAHETTFADYTVERYRAPRDYKAPREIVIAAQPSCMIVAAEWEPNTPSRPLFQLPRTKSFIRSFTDLAREVLPLVTRTLNEMSQTDPVHLLPKPSG